MIVSAAILGAAVGSACGGALSDRLGRKTALKIADGFFVCGALVMAVAPTAAVLIAGAALLASRPMKHMLIPNTCCASWLNGACSPGRLLVGLGVGLASVTAPVYIAETAPANVRAALVAANTLMITTGQFFAFLLDFAFTFTPGTWRYTSDALRQ